MLREQQQRWVIPWFHLAHLCHLTCVTLLRSVLHATSYPTRAPGLEADACCWLALIVFISSFFPLTVVLLPWVSKLSGEIVLIVSFYGVKYFWNCCAVDPKSAQVSFYFLLPFCCPRSSFLPGLMLCAAWCGCCLLPLKIDSLRCWWNYTHCLDWRKTGLLQ